MYGVRAEQIGRRGPLPRMNQQRPVLPAAQAAVAADQLLERGDLLHVRVEQAVDQQIAGVREPVVPPQIVRGIRPEPTERVDTLNAITLASAARPATAEQPAT